MAVKILTDSTADLHPDVVEKLGVTVVPMTINVGSSKLRDGIDITARDFFKRVDHSVNPPTSSAPTVRQFE